MPEKAPTRSNIYRTKLPLAAWFLLLISIIGTIAAVILGYFSYTWEIAHHGTAKSMSILIPYLCVGSVFLFAVLFTFIKLITNKSVEIIIQEESLQINFKGKEWRIFLSEILNIFRRDEITLFLVIPRRKQEFEIHTTNGVAKIEGNISHYKEFLGKIEAMIYPGLYLKDQELIALGKTIKFGEILLNQQGLKYGETILLWNQIADVKVVRGRVVIRNYQDSKIRTIKIPARKIPNIPIFLKLAEENIHTAGSL